MNLSSISLLTISSTFLKLKLDDYAGKATSKIDEHRSKPLIISFLIDEDAEFYGGSDVFFFLIAIFLTLTPPKLLYSCI
jgi:hypothetical protein